MPVELKLTFNSLEELETFLNRPASGISINHSATPTQQPSPPLAAIPAASSPPAASVVPLINDVASRNAQAAASSAANPLDLAKHEMTQLMTKLPSGQGALKVKEILSKYGLSRLGGATPEQLSALVNDFQTAQLAA